MYKCLAVYRLRMELTVKRKIAIQWKINNTELCNRALPYLTYLLVANLQVRKYHRDCRVLYKLLPKFRYDHNYNKLLIHGLKPMKRVTYCHRQKILKMKIQCVTTQHLHPATSFCDTIQPVASSQAYL